MPEITALTIVNRACALIGEDALQSLDDETAGGSKAALAYDSVLDFCLGLTDWTFLRSIQQLARLSDVTPKTGFAYAYQIPGSDWQAVQWFADGDMDHAITHFEISDGQFHCDEGQVFAQVPVARSPQYWPGTFRHAVTVAVAAELAMVLAHDKAVKDMKSQEAFGPPSANGRAGLMGAAIQADARNSPVRTLPLSNPLLDAWNS